jgi:hypothetical protein
MVSPLTFMGARHSGRRFGLGAMVAALFLCLAGLRAENPLFGVPPAAFTKQDPGAGQGFVVTSVTLTWSASVGADQYWLCVDTTNNNACDSGWMSVGANLQVDLTDLKTATAYYWQWRRRMPQEKPPPTSGTRLPGGVSPRYRASTTSARPARRVLFPASIRRYSGDVANAVNYDAASM